MKLEAPPGFEPGVEVLQTSALPLGDGALKRHAGLKGPRYNSHEFLACQQTMVGLGPPTVARVACRRTMVGPPTVARLACLRAKVGAGNGIRTRDFDLGKVALYH
jgi:hypothetical protein